MRIMGMKVRNLSGTPLGGRVKAVTAVINSPDVHTLKEPSREAAQMAQVMHAEGVPLVGIAAALDRMGESLSAHYPRQPGHSRWDKAAVRFLLDRADLPAPTTTEERRAAAQSVLDSLKGQA